MPPPVLKIFPVLILALLFTINSTPTSSTIFHSLVQSNVRIILKSLSSFQFYTLPSLTKLIIQVAIINCQSLVWTLLQLGRFNQFISADFHQLSVLCKSSLAFISPATYCASSSLFPNNVDVGMIFNNIIQILMAYTSLCTNLVVIMISIQPPGTKREI
jgi:hypothetical protein